MKLHLPKALIITLCGVTCTTNVDAATTTTTTYTAADGTTYKHVDVGFKGTGNNYISTHAGDLEVNSNDKVGAFNGEALMTKGSLTYDKKNWSNSLKVNGTLTINGSGQVYLGGQNSSYYSGVIANEVKISNTATGTSATPNLYADSAEIGKLTINGGTAVFHREIYNGNGYPTLGDEKSKQTKISNIYLETGTLSLGSESNNAHNEGHYNTVLGSSSTDCKVEQKSGTMTVNGYTIAMNGLTLDQDGGTMTFNDRIAVATSTAGDSGSITGNRPVTFNIKQGGESKDTKLSFGDIGTVNHVVDLWFTKYSPWKASSVSVNVDQTGNGTINIGDKMEIATYSICQGIEKDGIIKGVDGVINQNGNITASDIYITGTLVNNGTINKTDDNSLLEIVGGKVENNGKIAMDIYMEDGELTATNGSTFTNITAKEGVITISGTVNITGELILGNATMVSTFSANSTEGKVVVNLLDAKSGINLTDIDNLALGKDVVFNVMVDSLDDLKANDTLTIFNLVDNENNETVNITQQITVTDKDGNEKVVTYTDKGNGSVTVNAVVPEPTTATLSLLALAALASRRRRK